jgi:hypothetical protein
MNKKLGNSQGNPKDKMVFLIDRINVKLEVLESIISREVSKQCDCISSGWVYMVMEALEEVRDSIAELKGYAEQVC